VNIARQNTDNLFKQISSLSNLIEKVIKNKVEHFNSHLKYYLHFKKKAKNQNAVPIDTIKASIENPWLKVSSKFAIVTTGAIGISLITFLLVQNKKIPHFIV
jgi:hypothetical protein